MTSIVDLRHSFFGGSGDAEKEFLEEAYGEGISAADLLALTGPTLTKQAEVGQTDPLLVLRDETGDVAVAAYASSLIMGHEDNSNSYLALPAEYGELLLSPPGITGYAIVSSSAVKTFAEVRASAGQTDPLLRLNDDNGNAVFEVRPDGGIFTDLPTANPNVAGRLWNDGGTVKVSAG